MRIAEIREKTVDELASREGDLRRELFNLRFQAATGEIQNPTRMRQIRREIAQIKTVVSAKAKEAAKKDGK